MSTLVPTFSSYSWIQVMNMYSKAFACRVCAALRAWSSRHFCSCRSICAGPSGQFGFLCFKMRLGGLFECLCSFGLTNGFSLVIHRRIFIECFGMALDCPVWQVGVFLLSKSYAEHVEVKFFLLIFGGFWVILVSVCLALVLSFEAQWKWEAVNDVRAPLVFESGSLADILIYQFIF